MSEAVSNPTLILLIVSAIAWAVLALVFHGVQIQGDTKTVVIGDTQTVTTTWTTSLLATQLVGIVMPITIACGFWLYIAVIFRLPSRLNMIRDEEVESEE